MLIIMRYARKVMFVFVALFLVFIIVRYARKVIPAFIALFLVTCVMRSARLVRRTSDRQVGNVPIIHERSLSVILF